jgi:MOB kinase activator 1
VCFLSLDTPFPKGFKNVVKTIFKRLFRIYAHIYYSHAQEIIDLGVEAHLNTAFKHFYLFIQEFDLVDPKEMAPLHHLIDKINNQLREKDAMDANSSRSMDDDDDDYEE